MISVGLSGEIVSQLWPNKALEADAKRSRG